MLSTTPRPPGTLHDSIASLLSPLPSPASTKSYSLIVCLSPSSSQILLGLKKRGFGTGLYNSFGGKIEQGETPATGAARELEEEAGVRCPVNHMERCRVGDLHFTFADTNNKMLVHLFCVDLDSAEIDASSINWECDEIAPRWFPMSEVPFGNMFADDSVWLPMLLKDASARFSGYFHFQPGGDKVNLVDSYFLDLNSSPQ
jgi:8-oxo-dGTP diphosphatase/8-oxo-dGTP diphosphatase/2-hydroxy-dATP diphosphatase